VALAARLGFTIDRDTVEAIRSLRGEIVKSSPARILDELYKILRQGASRKTFQMLHELGLLAYLLPEADDAIAEQGERLLGSLSRLDDYRNAGLAAPEELTNPLVMGTLLVPLGLPLRRVAMTPAPRREEEEGVPETPAPLDVAMEMEDLGGEAAEALPDGVPGLSALNLPFARRDLEMLRLILAAQNRLREVHSSPRVKHLLAGRGYLEEALRWMEIHGGVQGQELATYWRSLEVGEEVAPPPLEPDAADAVHALPRRPRPRRRRRRRRSGSAPPAPVTTQ